MPYTAQSYVDEVLLRLNRYQVSIELDPGTAEVLVNDARRVVQGVTIQMFPERYSAKMTLDLLAGNTATRINDYDTSAIFRSPNGAINTVVNTVWRMNLPLDFIDIECVQVESAAGQVWEARRVTKQELYAILRNTSKLPTPRQPVYLVEKPPTSNVYQIYVSKGDEPVDVAEVTVWYLKALKYLQLFEPTTGQPDVEVVMSYEFEELVVLQAMLDALKKTNFQAPETKGLLEAEYMREVSDMQQRYNSAIDRAGLGLAAREGLYPNNPLLEVPQNGLAPQAQR